jgi:tryptophanyl-tRNA synthetase
MKPTGRLHLGNLVGALRSWVRLQDDHDVFCFVADWHAYTTGAHDPARIAADAREVALDFLAAGMDPARSAIFLQSQVKEHAELYLLLSMITPVSWLERVPTYKDTILTARIESPTHGLLGYPVLQAADVLLYRAEVVPVGRDQLPHLELAREIARRFDHLFGPVFPEPRALLSDAPVLPGIDGRKMSKSHGNVIHLADSEEETARKIMDAFTTPTKIRATDPGIPESCSVCQWRRVFDPDGWRASWDEDRAGRRGCVRNKRELVELLNAELAPLRARRRELEKDPGELDRILADGAARACAAAADTMADVRRAMRLP